MGLTDPLYREDVQIYRRTDTKRPTQVKKKIKEMIRGKKINAIFMLVITAS